MSKSTYDTSLVEDLAKLINEHELAEIEYDTEGLRLRVTRVPSGGFAAYSHTSVAIMDALLAYDGTVIEVHLSNIHRRDEFRRLSYVSKAADGVICGLGKQGYLLAVEAAASLIDRE